VNRTGLCPCCGNGVLLGYIETATPSYNPTVRMKGDVTAGEVWNYVEGFTPTVGRQVLVSVQNWQAVAIIGAAQ
jgi:hypothetical protein